ncbi:hypothetical protein [Halorhabdus rudnickae]|uniref:hypothetical protein n=1 Tax=Halorhabdus rudnickae TaxID=1775544 RepID=UPI001FCE86A6|nr:hypothetical protein [Halorhabdus rudnickae]
MNKSDERDLPIRGAVCRVQPQWSHSEFLDAAEPSVAMMNLEDARRVVKRGEDAESYFPGNTTVIATSTIDDDLLDIIPWKHNDFRRGELDIVREFEPDYYVPMDHSDYNDIPKEERLSRVKKVFKGTLWLRDKLHDEGVDTELIPLLKGCTLDERQYSYQLFEELNASLVAYYAVNYFDGGGTPLERIVDDLETITEETDRPILLIGLLSPNYLARVPEQVVAGAGQHAWRDQVTPRKENPLSMRETHEQLEIDVANALGVTPTVAEPLQSSASANPPFDTQTKAE